MIRKKRAPESASVEPNGSWRTALTVRPSMALNEAGASIVDGFLITGGGRSSVAMPSWIGGGFYIYKGSPTILNNVIEKNQTCPPVKQDQEALGGGIYATGSTISILDNVIRNNVSGRGAGVACKRGRTRGSTAP